MQRLEVSCAVRRIYMSLCAEGLMCSPERYVYWPAFFVQAKSCGTSDLVRRYSTGIHTITSEFDPGDKFFVITLEVKGAVIL